MTTPELEIQAFGSTAAMPPNQPITKVAVRLERDGLKVVFLTDQMLGRHVLLSLEVAKDLTTQLQQQTGD